MENLITQAGIMLLREVDTPTSQTAITLLQEVDIATPQADIML